MPTSIYDLWAIFVLYLLFSRSLHITHDHDYRLFNHLLSDVSVFVISLITIWNIKLYNPIEWVLLVNDG